MNREEHLLTILAEECGETIQVASKALRFGLNDGYPDQEITNAEDLVNEFNDILAVMEILLKEGFIYQLMDREKIEMKKEKVEKYMEYSKKVGKLK